MIQLKLKTCAGCGPGKHIYKNIAGKKYCKQCVQLMEPVTKIRNRSVKRAAQERRHSAEGKLLKVKVGKCEAGLPGCTGHDITTLTISHTKGRIGDLLTDEKHQQVICFHCHSFITSNPRMAKALGLEKSRLAVEAEE